MTRPPTILPLAAAFLLAAAPLTAQASDPWYCDANQLRGDASGDGDLNLSDAIHILDHLFQGGPAPVCGDAADANNDGEVNLSDSSFLLSYLFSGGQAPEPPWAMAIGEEPLLGIRTAEDPIIDFDDPPWLTPTTLPVVMEIADVNEESPRYTHCFADSVPVDWAGNALDVPTVFFQSSWEERDLGAYPLELELDEWMFWGDTDRVQVYVYCEDVLGRSSEVIFRTTKAVPVAAGGGGAGYGDCDVEWMTIVNGAQSLRNVNGHDLSSQFTSYDFLPRQTIKTGSMYTGHIEGWLPLVTTRGTVNQHMVARGWYAVAKLTDGSDPKQCTHHQFLQRTGTRVANRAFWGLGSHAASTPGFHYTDNTLDTTQLQAMTLPTFNQLTAVKTNVWNGKPTGTHCARGSPHWCSDSYDAERKLGTADALKYVTLDDGSEFIVWFDAPMHRFSQTAVQGATGATPWTLNNTGEVSPSGLLDSHRNFLSIVENTFGNRRVVCEQTNSHFHNLAATPTTPGTATDATKFSITAPECNCEVQEYTTGGWEMTSSAGC